VVAGGPADNAGFELGDIVGAGSDQRLTIRFAPDGFS
jgi:hypothetical protein